jgi:hypothetical protein
MPRERGIQRYRLLQIGKPVLEVAVHPTEIQIVGFQAGFIAPPAASKLQPQFIHDSASDFVLNREDIHHVPVEPA